MEKQWVLDSYRASFLDLIKPNIADVSAFKPFTRQHLWSRPAILLPTTHGASQIVAMFAEEMFSHGNEAWYAATMLVPSWLQQERTHSCQDIMRQSSKQ